MWGALSRFLTGVDRRFAMKDFISRVFEALCSLSSHT